MKIYNLTTTLNIKIVTIVFLLLIMITIYNHWLSLQEEHTHNVQPLIEITDFLAKRAPPQLFSKIEAKKDPMTTKESHLLALNDEIQPFLEDIYLPVTFIRFGFYSKAYGNIVAVGPQLDKALVDGRTSTSMDFIEKSTAALLTHDKQSVVWYGSPAITYSRPIEENGQIVGHAFASINQEMIAAVVWKRTLYMFGGAVFMLLVCIAIFRELFVKLKKDLRSYAESILTADTCDYHSQVPEFIPILNYISEQTRQMTRLDRLNIIGEMAAGIAHEIRNPMTTVRGLLQYISKKPKFAEQQENFTLMIKELDCANAIITEFLSLSKDKAMEFKPNNINDIVKEVYPLLQADATYHNCTIQLDLQEIPLITLDKNSIHRLILNMVKNGVDAMPSGGTVTISTVNTGTDVLLSIRDEGIGIPDEIKDKLGTPFFTTKDHGTGLGLAICYRIALRHRTPLTIDSALGAGTTFTLQFTLQQTVSERGETK